MNTPIQPNIPTNLLTALDRIRRTERRRHEQLLALIDEARSDYLTAKLFRSDPDSNGFEAVRFWSERAVIKCFRVLIWCKSDYCPNAETGRNVLVSMAAMIDVIPSDLVVALWDSPCDTRDRADILIAAVQRLLRQGRDAAWETLSII